MGVVHAEITLSNVMDEGKADDGFIRADEVRTATVTAVVDTGAMNLVITEELFQKLGLRVVEERVVNIANGQKAPCKLTSPVKVRWKNRQSPVSAVVIPGAEKILLGVIPLEGMDLIVCPTTNELVGAYGDTVMIMVY